MQKKTAVVTRPDGTRWFGKLKIIKRAEIPEAGPGDPPGPLTAQQFDDLAFEESLLEAEGLPRYQRYLRRHRSA